MKKKAILLLSITGIWAMAGFAQTTKDSTRIAGSLTIDEVVVTGTRNETDIRHLPMTISVVNRKVLEQSFQPSVLPATDGASARPVHHEPRYHGIRRVSRERRAE